MILKLKTYFFKKKILASFVQKKTIHSFVENSGKTEDGTINRNEGVINENIEVSQDRADNQGAISGDAKKENELEQSRSFF